MNAHDENIVFFASVIGNLYWFKFALSVGTKTPDRPQAIDVLVFYVFASENFPFFGHPEKNDTTRWLRIGPHGNVICEIALANLGAFSLDAAILGETYNGLKVAGFENVVWGP
jgi:hypothetical protein